MNERVTDWRGHYIKVPTYEARYKRIIDRKKDPSIPLSGNTVQNILPYVMLAFFSIHVLNTLGIIKTKR